jgi:hypothetical protein
MLTHFAEEEEDEDGFVVEVGIVKFQQWGVIGETLIHVETQGNEK